MSIFKIQELYLLLVKKSVLPTLELVVDILSLFVGKLRSQESGGHAWFDESNPSCWVVSFCCGIDQNSQHSATIQPKLTHQIPEINGKLSSGNTGTGVRFRPKKGDYFSLSYVGIVKGTKVLHVDMVRKHTTVCTKNFPAVFWRRRCCPGAVYRPAAPLSAAAPALTHQQPAVIMWIRSRAVTSSTHYYSITPYTDPHSDHGDTCRLRDDHGLPQL